MVVLDTDLLIELLRNNKFAIDKIKEIEEQDTPISTTSITSYELIKGAYLSNNPIKSISQISSLLQNIAILNFDLRASNVCAKIYAYLKKRGTPTNTMDQMIAAISIANNKILITRNIKHYKDIPELKIENW